jgi:Arc/MetJ-type ribon-helix-helix transcriptional regulator
MKRATITLPDDLEQALERFVDEQEVPVQLTAVVQAAVREYLGERGYLETSSPLRIRPAGRGSGQKDVSISHDRNLASK